MEIQDHRSLAPDPLTEPEKCSGIRTGFTIISVLGIAVFVCAALALSSPSVYSFLTATSDAIFGANTIDATPLPRGDGPPILRP